MVGTQQYNNIYRYSTPRRDYVKEIMDKLGVKELYDFQKEAIRLINETDDNILVVAPTGSGKSLIGYYALARERGFYLAPYRAIMFEKYAELKYIFPEKKIVLTNKDYSIPRRTIKNADIRIMSPYKFLMYQDILEPSDGIVVVDEIHKILHDPDAESMLTYVVKRGYRIIALSATINEEDIGVVAKWLNARVVKGNIRPVELHHIGLILNHTFTGYRVAGVIYNGTPIDLDDASYNPALKNIVAVWAKNKRFTVRSGKDAIAATVASILLSDPESQIIVWSPWRDYANSLADIIATTLDTIASRERGSVPEWMKKPLYVDGIVVGNKHDQVLSIVLQNRVGIHHGGISPVNQRKVFELFKSGEIKVLVTCYTLSHGVNLPAKYVIISLPRNYDRSMMDATTYNQIAGRAGRPGLSNVGYVITFLYNMGDVENYMNLVRTTATRIQLPKPEDGMWGLTKAIVKTLYDTGSSEEALDLARRTLRYVLAMHRNQAWYMQEYLKYASEALRLSITAFFEEECSSGLCRYKPKGPREELAAKMGLNYGEYKIAEMIERGEPYRKVVEAAALYVASETGFDKDISPVVDYGLLVSYVSPQHMSLADMVQSILDGAAVYLARLHGYNSEPAKRAKQYAEAFSYGGRPELESLANVLRHDEMKRVVRYLIPAIMAKSDYKAIVESVTKLLYEGKKRASRKRIYRIASALAKALEGNDNPETLRRYVMIMFSTLNRMGVKLY